MAKLVWCELPMKRLGFSIPSYRDISSLRIANGGEAIQNLAQNFWMTASPTAPPKKHNANVACKPSGSSLRAALFGAAIQPIYARNPDCLLRQTKAPRHLLAIKRPAGSFMVISGLPRFARNDGSQKHIPLK